MKQLSNTQSVIMLLGACLMVVGVALYVFGGLYTSMTMVDVAPWVFAVGAIAFATMQMQQSYDGDDLTLRRLRRIMVTGDVLFIVSAVLMIENVNHWLLPLFLKLSPENGYMQYVTYVHNNWVVLLLVAAIIEIYTTHRISSELNKEAKKR